jgi:hypothetical protein
MLVTSIIMRRPEVAEPASQSEQRDSEATSARMPFAPPQRPASTWLDTFRSPLDLERVRLRLEWLLDTLVSAAVLGGVFAVPIATLIAMICVWLPASQPLHRTAPTFFGVASFWFIVALLLSHFQRRGSDEGQREAA